jgi:hypothetical protein
MQIAQRRWGRLLPALGIVLAACALVLFPFDWLADVWPTYGRLFDVVFASVQAHLIGHATIFLLAGALVLFALPGLRRHPLRYLGIMLLGAVAEEGLQSLAKRQLPTIWDGRDLLLDLIGFSAAYLAYLLVHALFSRRAPVAALASGDNPPEGRVRG